MSKVAFISGASRGIGKAIAEEFAANGYDLILTCEKSDDLLSELSTKLSAEYKTKILSFVGDISDAAFVEQISAQALAQFGSVDVLINNAGISHVGLLTDMSVEEWNRVMDVNLCSCFLTSKVFVPSMVAKQSGSIINISSMWGRVGASCEVAYSASKAGMNGFTQALAKELAPSNIAVNALACGVIDTEMNEHLSAEEKVDLAEQIPAGRFATSKEVAQAVYHIANSPSYLTGQIIGFDGGFV